MIALHAREKTGRGQMVDIAEAETLAMLYIAVEVSDYLMNGAEKARVGLRMDGNAPTALLPCKDGYVYLMALTDEQWSGLVDAMGNPDWATTDLFLGGGRRRAVYAREIYDLLRPWLQAHTAQEIFDRCQARSAPAAPLYTVADLMSNEHLDERGFFVDLPDERSGPLRIPGPPFRFGLDQSEAPASKTLAPWAVERRAPRLGEHNEAVYCGMLGLDRAELPALRRAGGHLMPTAAVNGKRGAEDDLPLAGLRVLNLGWYWVCATMSHLLADMGAEVIKVDSRQRLETLRGIPPFMDGIEDPDRNLWLHNLLRNTQSITVNLETAEGRERLRDLVRTADVVTENWTPGTVAKLGIDYASLRPYRPDLIMVSPSAAGQWGPYRRINTYGQVISTLAGLDAVQGYPGERPANFGMSNHRPVRGPDGLLRSARRTAAPQRDRPRLPRRLLAVGNVDGDDGAALSRLPVERQAARPRRQPRHALRPQQRLSLVGRRPLGLDFGLRGGGVAGTAPRAGAAAMGPRPALRRQVPPQAQRGGPRRAHRRVDEAPHALRGDGAPPGGGRCRLPGHGLARALQRPALEGPRLVAPGRPIRSAPSGSMESTGSSAARRGRSARRRRSSASTTAASSATSWARKRRSSAASKRSG